MTWSMRWFIIFLLINTIITVVYLIIAIFFKKTNRHLAYLRAIPMLLAPGVGPLFILLGRFGYEFIFRKDVDLSDVVFSKIRERELVRTNEEVERNVVPLEEAIEISDNAQLRGLVMGVAQGDFEDSLASISLALNCEDTETAHYAASVLQDALNDFRLKVSRQVNFVEKRDEKLEKIAPDLIEYMNKFLVQKVFTDIEQRSFANTMERVGQILFEEKPELVDADMCEQIAMRLLEVKSYEKCEKWCNRSAEIYPDTLSSFTNKLKLYFNNGRKDEFFRTMEELKAAPIIIDSETLELIRTFS